MRAIFLTFEAVLTVFWFWCAIATFSFFSRGTSDYIEHPDYGTFIGGLLFLAFGVGTAAMLGHEFLQIYRRYTATHPDGMLALKSQGTVGDWLRAVKGLGTNKDDEIRAINGQGADGDEIRALKGQGTDADDDAGNED